MEENFKITDDKTADWAVGQIAVREAERDRLIKLANDEIADLVSKCRELETKCDNDTAYLRSCLIEYFNTVPHKETKTQESYDLLKGKLVFKKPTIKINHDDEKLIEWLAETEYVETKKSLKWGEYKKNLTVNDDGVVIDTETGEVVEACTVEEVPASFSIKFKED